jgi:hypothetical protein
VSSHDVPAFDAIAGQRNPFAGFGQILSSRRDVERRFWEENAAARERIRKSFGRELRVAEKIPIELDSIVQGMWNTGWDPNTGNLNLFSCDLGLVLTGAIVELLGGQLIFRSENDMSHCSIFWESFEFEAFPFLKVLKRLLDRHEDSIGVFVDGLVNRIKLH